MDKARLNRFWDGRWQEDRTLYELPLDVIGRRYRFATESRMLMGTIISVEYGDDGLPMLEVSNLRFAGDRIDCLYPSNKLPGEWILKTSHRKDLAGTRESTTTSGILTFF